MTKKTLVFIVVSGLFFLSGLCMELSLTDGTVIRNAHILNGTDSGLQLLISSPENSGFLFRHVDYSQLTAESLLKAAVYPGSGLNTLRDILQNKKSVMAWDGKQQGVLPQGIPSFITLDSIRVWNNGTIGWANSNPGYSNNIPYGRIYVSGLQIDGMNRWTGFVFPTVKIIRYRHWAIPCFALTAHAAAEINRQ